MKLTNNPWWMEFYRKEVLRLFNLEHGWDGYNGVELSEELFNKFVKLFEIDNYIPKPQITPGSVGDFQLKWHENGMDLEIDVAGVGYVGIYVYSKLCKMEYENNFDLEDDSELVEFLKVVNEMVKLINYNIKNEKRWYYWFNYYWVFIYRFTYIFGEWSYVILIDMSKNNH